MYVNMQLKLFAGLIIIDFFLSRPSYYQHYGRLRSFIPLMIHFQSFLVLERFSQSFFVIYIFIFI